MKQFTDKEIEQRLEQLTFAIALDTTHFHAFCDHKRHNIREELQANKQALRKLRQERERRIIAGTYNP
jgi:hypothetical protein